MNSLIFQVVARLLVPIMFLFSLFLCFRGHNNAGGGFIGGLVCGASLIIYALAFTTSAVKKILIVKDDYILGAGLALALSSTLFAVFELKPLMTTVWFENTGIYGFGSPLLFDLGVYLVVIAMSVKILIPLLEDTN